MNEQDRNRAVIEYLLEKPERIAELIDELNRSGIVDGNDKTLLVAIKRNIEFGMQQRDLINRMIEIGRHSPKLIALFVAAGVYRYYGN